MSRPSVSLVTGRHITAAEKRLVLEGVEYLRQTFAPVVDHSPDHLPNYASMRMRRRGSKKSYTIAPIQGSICDYSVVFHTTTTNSYGRKFVETINLVVRLTGVEPLYTPPSFAKPTEGLDV